LPTLSSDERRRRVPFLTVLGERERESARASERARESERASERESPAHAARTPHPARAAAARTSTPTTRARQAHAHPPRPPRRARLKHRRPHPARADTAHTPTHATRDRPTRARTPISFCENFMARVFRGLPRACWEFSSPGTYRTFAAVLVVSRVVRNAATKRDR
jgi:hypothetical protein